jgi:hypothetical protein
MLQIFPITKEAVQTIFNGALGAMTFGAYAQFQNNQLQEQKMNKMLEENEKKIQNMINKRSLFGF